MSEMQENELKSSDASFIVPATHLSLEAYVCHPSLPPTFSRLIPA